MKKIFNISSIKRIEYRNDINGLRAIAVLSVIFYHADIELFKGGWLGVDVFFVISGYLISNIIISELNDGYFTFKNFYLRRVKRILPALFSTLALTLPFAYYLLTTKAIIEYARSLLSSIFFYANYYFLNLDFYNAEPAKFIPLLHTWSLAIEEQFYIIFPLFCFLIFKTSKKVLGYLILFTIIYSLYLNISSIDPTKFYKLEFRMWELLLGALIMILSSNFKIKNLDLIGYPIMLFPIFYFNHYWINDIEPKLISLLGVSMVLYSNEQKSFFAKLFDNKFITLVGLSSYSIYLFHQPIFSFFRVYKFSKIENILNNSTDISFVEVIVLVLITLLVGYLNYTFIEKTFLFKKIQIKSFGSCLIILILFSVLIINNNLNSFKSRDIPNQVLSLAVEENRSIFQDGRSCDNRELTDLCFFDNNSSIEVITIGDSSFRNMQTLVESSSLVGFNYTHLTHGGCLYIVETSFREKDCGMYERSELDNFVNGVRNSIVIYGGRFPFYMNEERFFNGYVLEKGPFSGSNNLSFEEKKFYIHKTIDMFLSNNNFVVLVYPIPEQGWDVYELYFNKTIDWSDDLGYPTEIFKERVNSSYLILDELKDKRIYRIIPESIFCDTFIEEQCAAKYKDKIFYLDDDHLSLDGQNLVSQKIIEQIEEIILFNK